MKIYYYQREDHQPNFGDELNAWLWPKFLTNTFDQDSDFLFVGIGTLLNNRLPKRIKSAKSVVIMGTGAGYEQPLRQIPGHWQIYCVRGPLSAKQLRLPPSKAIADGGLLINRVFSKSQSCSFAVSFIPHIHHASYATKPWQAICQAAGIHYIDPRWSVEQVLTEISQSQLLLAEAMHGAIAADALRVPWIPIVTSSRILHFKWQDWCQSMHLTYKPQFVPPLSHYPQISLLSHYPRRGRKLRTRLSAGHHWWRSFAQNTLKTARYGLTTDSALISQCFIQIIKNAAPSLSKRGVLSMRLAQLEEQLYSIQS
ncbi:MAG: polysaccharide pyruvyl transferase family protein [Cyanobacteria bacterium J06635_1]